MHIATLRQHYHDKGRPEALRNLRSAIRDIPKHIAAGSGLPAPRPYPQLARPGRALIKVGRYWIAYTLSAPPVVVAVLYEEADIPGRAPD